MIRKSIILFIAVLWSSAIFAQQDTTNNILPEELTADSITSDSGSYNDTVYIVYSTHPQDRHHHRHWKRSHFSDRKTLQQKAAKRRHKMAVKKAKQRRQERIAATHKRAKSHSAHRSSSHSSHSIHSGHSTHSTSHRSGHSRGRR